MLKKLWKYRWAFRYIIPSIYFNFHYLPFSQAVRLPILLYKPKLLKCKGTIQIQGKIKTGMIQLGKYNVSLYPNSGITYENHGGTIKFNGNASIGNNSAISIGEKGNLLLGNNFNATTSLKITSYHHIEFKDNVLVGWECIFMDTDFHQLTFTNNNTKPKAFDKILIGENCWFSLKCITMKGTILAANNVVSANSFLNKDYGNAQYCLFAGQPAVLKKNNIFRNPQNDKIIY